MNPISHKTYITVRYAETDRMGYVYYGNYAIYFEVARVETLKSIGISYKELEDSGILLPVLDYQIKYFQPAFYDENIEIITTIKEVSPTRIYFEYNTINSNKAIINKASTTLIFVSVRNHKPCRIPPDLKTIFKQYFIC